MSGEKLAKLWSKIPAHQKGRKTCALIKKIRLHPEKWDGASVLAESSKIKPADGGRDWDAFFKALAEFINAIAPLFKKDEQ